jgi:hypothetical protein
MLCADGSVPFGHVRVGRCQGPNKSPVDISLRGFFFWGVYDGGVR